MPRLVLLLLGAFALVWTFPAEACQFDSDCAIGSRCERGAGSLYGWCLGGMNPGNTYDRQPSVDRTDPSGKRGSTCRFDSECGPGQRCERGAGMILGVCI